MNVDEKGSELAMSCYCDFEEPSVYNKTTPKARKVHRCSECGATIQKGERYENVSGVWDGYADTYKTCERCLDLRNFVEDNVPCICWHHGNIIDECRDAAREYGEQGDGLLFGTYRRILITEGYARKQLANT